MEQKLLLQKRLKLYEDAYADLSKLIRAKYHVVELDSPLALSLKFYRDKIIEYRNLLRRLG